MKTLENKTAFITGGSRGIGAAIVRKLAEQGANIAFTFQSNTTAANEVIESIAKFGKKYKAYQCDSTDQKKVTETMSLFFDEFKDIDILVNNAGIIKDNLIAAMPFEDWNKVLETNLSSAFLYTQAVSKSMVANRKGCLINISSIVGITGNAGQVNYAASKAGLIGFTKTIAKELGARNIRCNAIAPGIIQTDMTANLENNINNKSIPLRRIGTSEDVANLVLFLASDASKYITGQVINVCGGLSI